jgi:MtN3 and saliva related transmembrane protein
MDSITLLGYVAGFLVVISLVPQTIKAWKTKLTRDISLWRYIIYVVGLILWITYAYLTNNGPVAVTNSLGLVLALMILGLKIKYK